jgi:hypothetical protein
MGESSESSDAQLADEEHSREFQIRHNAACMLSRGEPIHFHGRSCTARIGEGLILSVAMRDSRIVITAPPLSSEDEPLLASLAARPCDQGATGDVLALCEGGGIVVAAVIELGDLALRRHEFQEVRSVIEANRERIRIALESAEL